MEDDSCLTFSWAWAWASLRACYLRRSPERRLVNSCAKAEESGDYVKSQADNLKETAAEALERSKQTIQKHKENLASAVEAGKQAYREATATPGD